MATITASSTICDPNGDLILIVGEKKHRIRVSSKILCLTSSVFRAMLGPNFKEGNELASGSVRQVSPWPNVSEYRSLSSSTPYELPLPDDDQKAMELFCNILHHQAKSIPTRNDRSLSLLRELAIIANKYDCADSVKVYASGCIDWWMLKENYSLSVADSSHLILTTFLLDYPLEFKGITGRVIRECPFPVLELVDHCGLAFVPFEVFSEIHRRRSSLRQEICNSLHRLEEVKDAIKMTNLSRKCVQFDHQVVSIDIINALKPVMQASILDSGVKLAGVEQQSVLELENCLRNFDFATPLHDFLNQNAHLRKCQRCNVHFKRDFISGLLSAVDGHPSSNGLCLDCVRRNIVHGVEDSPQERPECRVSHDPKRSWG